MEEKYIIDLPSRAIHDRILLNQQLRCGNMRIKRHSLLLGVIGKLYKVNNLTDSHLHRLGNAAQAWECCRKENLILSRP